MGHATIWQARYEQARRIDTSLRGLSRHDAVRVFASAHDYWTTSGGAILEAFETAIEDVTPTSSEREETTATA
jgi:hypothetical protein